MNSHHVLLLFHCCISDSAIACTRTCSWDARQHWCWCSSSCHRTVHQPAALQPHADTVRGHGHGWGHAPAGGVWCSPRRIWRWVLSAAASALAECTHAAAAAASPDAVQPAVPRRYIWGWPAIRGQYLWQTSCNGSNPRYWVLSSSPGAVQPPPSRRGPTATPSIPAAAAAAAATSWQWGAQRVGHRGVSSTASATTTYGRGVWLLRCPATLACCSHLLVRVELL
jgi:hypothetical protein